VSEWTENQAATLRGIAEPPPCPWCPERHYTETQRLILSALAEIERLQHREANMKPRVDERLGGGR
jgi:hypothetical protein